jgi:dATP pyrophosphohydrolase
MARSPFQILVFPYYIVDGNPLYALFRRSDDDFWQGIAGGGEDSESPEEAARREANEEASLPIDAEYVRLQTMNSIPVMAFRDNHLWGENLFVIPEYCFGVKVDEDRISISAEHKEFKWVRFEDAQEMLNYDGNRTALWELSRRIRGKGPRE